MGELRTTAIRSTSWSLFETFFNKGLQFAIGIVLARLLLPEDYGIIGVLAIFLGIAGVLVDGGFKTSIIRTPNLTCEDCSTIFYVNLIVSCTISLVLFLAAPKIALFFDKPELTNVARALTVLPIFNGMGLVQLSLLQKKMRFGRNAKIAIFSSIVSGIFGIALAYLGFSYWALVWKTIILSFIYNLLLWVTGDWYPRLVFSTSALKRHFRFSSRLLITNIFASIFQNIYSFVFGKYFSFQELGYFTKGRSYVDLSTKTLSVAINRINTPLLAQTENDQTKTSVYYKLLSASALLIFPATALIVASSHSMIVFLIGEKWMPAIPYLQIIAIAGVFYPVLNSISSIYEVFGRSDIILKSALIDWPIQIIILFITVNISTMMVAWGMLFRAVIAFSIGLYFFNQVTKHSIKKTLYVLVKPCLIATIVGMLVYYSGSYLQSRISIGAVFLIQISLGFFLTISLFQILRIKEFEYLKTITKKILTRFILLLTRR